MWPRRELQTKKWKQNKDLKTSFLLQFFFFLQIEEKHKTDKKDSKHVKRI